MDSQEFYSVDPRQCYFKSHGGGFAWVISIELERNLPLWHKIVDVMSRANAYHTPRHFTLSLPTDRWRTLGSALRVSMPM